MQNIKKLFTLFFGLFGSLSRGCLVHFDQFIFGFILGVW